MRGGTDAVEEGREVGEPGVSGGGVCVGEGGGGPGLRGVGYEGHVLHYAVEAISIHLSWELIYSEDQRNLVEMTA